MSRKVPAVVTVVVDGVVTSSYRYTTLEDVTTRRRQTNASDPEFLANVVEGFTEAAKCLANFAPDEAGLAEAKEIRKRLSDIFSQALSTPNRRARVVVYFMERAEDESVDARPDPPDASTSSENKGRSTRYFVYDCAGGRPDSPRHREYTKRTAHGAFFCEMALERKQLVVKNIRRPPRKAPIDSPKDVAYGSFIATPFDGPDDQVRGAVSIDFPGTSPFDSFDQQVAWHIARLYRDTFRATTSSAEVTRDEAESAMLNIDTSYETDSEEAER